MRIATYYLETGREVDIYLNTETGVFTAEDAFLSTCWDFGKQYPTWNDVSAKWIELEEAHA